MQYFPIEIIDCIDSEKFDLNNYIEFSPIGCLFQVDLNYPDELHD